MGHALHRPLVGICHGVEVSLLKGNGYPVSAPRQNADPVPPQLRIAVAHHPAARNHSRIIDHWLLGRVAAQGRLRQHVSHRHPDD